jgi:hypothetical protein
MTITLNGTTGITTPDITSSGSLNIDASAPDDSLVVDASGNVGIATSSPTQKLHISNNGNAYQLIDSSGIANGYNAATLYKNSERQYRVGTLGTVGGFAGGAFVVYDETASAWRMVIDSSGRTLIGITASRPNGGVLQVSAQGQTGLVTYTTSTTSNNAAYFENGNGIVGTIVTNGTSTSYNTSSDYRLKEDWVAVADALTRVNALKPVNFAWITSGERVDGFLAHELAEVVPEAVSGEKDAMRDEEYEVTPAVLDDEGAVVTSAVMGTRSVPDYQGIDQSKLVPLLTAALQEALAKIDDLTARVSALEASNV